MTKKMDLSTYIEKLEQISTDNPWVAGIAQAMIEKARIESGLTTTQEPETSEPVDGNILLQDLTRFIARYLHCSEHQRNLLALWTLHTYCLDSVQVTPFLAIESVHKQSGKTLCLQLLQLLCNSAVLTTDVGRGIISGHSSPRETLLFDDCHLTLGTRNRSRKPALQALLASSFHSSLMTESTLGHVPFRAKAFATMGELPDAIVDRSIPIILEPLPRNENRWFSTNRIERFNLRRAEPDSESLRQRLSAWSRQHLQQLQQLPACAEQDFPPCFSPLGPRRMQLVEPLLQLADVVGGPWPSHIRKAIDYLFHEADNYHLCANRQLLEDLYVCFLSQRFPERFSTSFLLVWLHSQQNRIWQADGPINAHKLAQLLGAFEITPRLQRMRMDEDERPVARGYQLADFIPAWRRYMGIDVRRDLDGNYYPADLRAEYEAAKEELKRRNINKDKGCNGDVQVGETTVSAEQNAQTSDGRDRSFGILGNPGDPGNSQGLPTAEGPAEAGRRVAVATNGSTSVDATPAFAGAEPPVTMPNGTSAQSERHLS